MKNDLTSGEIKPSLIKLALPIVATSFIEMAYNLTDMFWVGRLGSVAVAAVGTGGFFTWLGASIILLTRMGTQIRVGHSYGQKNVDNMRAYIQAGIQSTLVVGVLFASLLILFRRQAVAFFGFQEAELIQQSEDYIYIIAFGIPLLFFNFLFTSIWNAVGHSRLPFILTGIGLVTNMILDPIFISGKFIPSFSGVRGAALATVTAEAFICLCFIFFVLKNSDIFGKIRNWTWQKGRIYADILKLGLPQAVQSSSFALIAMVLGRFVASWGAGAVAVQRLGSQFEQISWMTATGLSTAIAAFIAQNYGAGILERIKDGYRLALKFALILGVFASFSLGFFSKELYSLFLSTQSEIDMGGSYLQIQAVSQLFMCIEIVTAGAFSGLGETRIPSLVSIGFNFMRIPLALVLSSYTFLALNGIWWSISITSIFKGVVILIWMKFYMNKLKLTPSSKAEALV